MRSVLAFSKRYLVVLLFLFALSFYAPQANAAVVGDANGDSRVDNADYTIWLNNYKQNRSGPSNGDFNNNGTVDGIDYVLWIINYGRSAPSSTPQPSQPISTTIPNPTQSPSSPVTYAPISQAAYVVATNGNDANPGTLALPFRTIQKAADMAKSGNVVIIKAGTYNEHVKISNNGTAASPIVFQAESKGAVIITGNSGGFQPRNWPGDDGSPYSNIGDYITLRGLKFENISGPLNHKVVRASLGWVVEDCVFVNVLFGINVRGFDNVIRHTEFSRINGSDPHAIVGAEAHNIKIQNIYIHHVNDKSTYNQIARSAVTKFLFTNNLLLENSVTDNNAGPGFWLDWHNTNFVIRNNSFTNNKGVNQFWEGPGLWIEGNPKSKGQIYNNYFSGNTGSGLGILESTDLLIYNNTFVNNYGGIEFRNLDRGNSASDNQNYYIANINIRDNLFGNSSHAHIYTSIGTWSGWNQQSRNVIINHNYYRTGQTAPLFNFIGTTASSLTDVRTKLGFESTGQMVNATFELPK